MWRIEPNISCELILKHFHVMRAAALTFRKTSMTKEDAKQPVSLSQVFIFVGKVRTVLYTSCR